MDIQLLSCRDRTKRCPLTTRNISTGLPAVDSLNLSPRTILAFLDSVYTTSPTGILDQARRFDYKASIISTRQRLEESLLYVDSTLQLLSDPEIKNRYPPNMPAPAQQRRGLQFQKNRESSLFYYYKPQGDRQVKDSCTMPISPAPGMTSYRAGHTPMPAHLRTGGREFASCSLTSAAFSSSPTGQHGCAMPSGEMG